MEFKLKLKKCRFYRKEVEFLKYIIKRGGIYINLMKIITTKKWPTPINIKKIQSFFKFVNFNQNLIKKYSKYTEPLTQLIKK